MILLGLLTCLLGASVKSEPPIKDLKSPKTLLSPVRPLPCHSVTMIKDVRPTEFLFIAPGNSGDCSFIFEGLEDGRLDIKVRNLKSNLPRGNGDPCEDGQVRLYNYKGSGQVNLAQRLCDNEKEVTMLTDSNMAIVASSLIDGSFSVVARSVREADLLPETDVDQFLTPPETSTHDWTTKATPEQSGGKKENIQNNRNSENDTKDDDGVETTTERDDLYDSDDNQKEPSQDETPPDDDSFVPNYFLAADTNMTQTNHTKHNCTYNSYGYYVCDNSTNANHTDNSNHTGYYYTPTPVYHAPYLPYQSKPVYVPPYDHKYTYEAPKPEYHPPKPEYHPPKHEYSSQSHVYSPPTHYYSPPETVYPPSSYHTAPEHTYSAPESVYGHDHEYPYHYHDHDHEKPFRPSQPLPNDYWKGYTSHNHDNYYKAPVWYDEKGPYPGKPTKHVDLTHDTYPMYPSYYNPGNYYPDNNVTSTPSPTKAPSKRTTMNKPKTTTKKKDSPTTTKPTTKHHHSIFGIPLPWTANITITSGDNLETSVQEENQMTSSTTTPRINLNRIINNLPKNR